MLIERRHPAEFLFKTSWALDDKFVLGILTTRSGDLQIEIELVYLSSVSLIGLFVQECTESCCCPERQQNPCKTS